MNNNVYLIVGSEGNKVKFKEVFISPNIMDDWEKDPTVQNNLNQFKELATGQYSINVITLFQLDWNDSTGKENPQMNLIYRLDFNPNIQKGENI